MLTLLLTLACAGGDTADTADTGPAALTPEELVAYYGEPGPYGVGYTEQELTYTDPAGQPRTLRLATWYPSPDTSGAEVQYLGFVEAPGVMRDAAVQPGRHPVVVFSHGHMGYAEASGFMLAHLASHGWLVASPDHTGNTTFDGDDRTTEIYFQRPADISAALDHLGAAWADSADLERVVGMGHSFGGYTLHALAGAAYDIDTVAAACQDGSYSGDFCSALSPAYQALFAAGFEDDRIDAALPLGAGDNGLFNDGIAGIDVPGLWVAGELDGANEGAAAVYAAVQGGPDGQDLHRRVEVLGAGHNFCIDLTAALDLDTPIEDEEGFRVARVLAATWAARHGLGDTAVDPILDGEVPISDAVVLYR